jgi:phosphatidylglycerophosphate synthase
LGYGARHSMRHAEHLGEKASPTIAELRAVTQPESLLLRPGEEHWAGRLYMRRVSPYVTRLLVGSPLSANAVTALMIPAGLLAAFMLTLPGLLPAVGAVLFAQLWLLLDCCDGEVARWRRTFSPTGIYLDGIGHIVAQAALPAGLGVRADGGWDSIGGWTTLGLLVSILVLVLSVESYLVHFVRARTGKPLLDPGYTPSGPRLGALRALRRAVGLVPFYRAFNPIEGTLLALVAAVADAFTADLAGTRILLLALLAAGSVSVIGHLLVILSSDRLR